MQGLRDRVDDVVGHFGVGDQHHVEGDQVGRLRDPVERGVRRDLHHVGARQKRLCALQRLGRSADFQDAQSSDARVRLLDRRRAQGEEQHVDFAAHEVLRLPDDVRRGNPHHVAVPQPHVREVRLDDPRDRLLRVELARDALAFEIGDRIDPGVGAHVHGDPVRNERADVAHRRLPAPAFVFPGAGRIESRVERVRHVEISRAAFHFLEPRARLCLDDGPELRPLDQHFGDRLPRRVGEGPRRGGHDADRLGDCRSRQEGRTQDNGAQRFHGRSPLVFWRARPPFLWRSLSLPRSGTATLQQE